MNTDSQTESTSIPPEPCWEVLERAASSPSFKRAARLREFLFYAGTKSLREGRTDIHEQEIGHAVFGRAEGYDTSQDNIVRVSATELRKRVDAYFAGAGKDERIVFEIPRGSYAPLFRMRPAAPEPASSDTTGPVTNLPSPIQPATNSPLEIASGPAARTSPHRRTQLLILLLMTSTLLLAVVCAILWRENRILFRQLHPAGVPAPTSTSPGTSTP